MTAVPDPLVSIVIVNFNAGDFLRPCLESILDQTRQSFEVILVDNASADRSLGRVPTDRRFCVHQNGQNLGFACAQNQGLRLARGRYLLPLNFDIRLAPGYLEAMVTAAESSDHAGTVAPKLLQMEAGGGATDRFDNAGLLLPGGRLPQHRGRGEQDQGQYDQPEKIFGAMGAAALYRVEMLKDIAYRGQYFDESFFTWYEDIDLDWRARLRGWDCLYAPQAVAYHAGDPHGHNRSRFGAETSMRNRWMMILANECPSCFARHAGRLSAVEAGLLNHVFKQRLVVPYLRAVRSLAVHLPEIWRKRRWVRGRAKLPCLPEFPLPI